MQQAFLEEIAVAVLHGRHHPLTVGDGPFAGTRHAAAVVKSHHHRNRQTSCDIETAEDLDADIEIRGPLLHRVEVGEVGEIAQMDLLKTDSHADEALGMAGIAVVAAVELFDVVDLGNVVLDQTGNELIHAGIAGP